jgi:CII-binding regulator of phage lambda lysogenization HflD
VTTDTLHDYDRLVDTGFSDDQARALVELLTVSGETSPDVTQSLLNIDRRLEEQGDLLHRISEKVTQIDEDVTAIEARLHIIDERMQSESRIQRMLNTTLIAMGALLGSRLAVFAR